MLGYNFVVLCVEKSWGMLRKILVVKIGMLGEGRLGGGV